MVNSCFLSKYCTNEYLMLRISLCNAEILFFCSAFPQIENAKGKGFYTKVEWQASWVGEVPLPFHVRNVFLLSQHKKLSLAWFALGREPETDPPANREEFLPGRAHRTPVLAPNVFVKFTRHAEPGRNKNITYNARFYLFPRHFPTCVYSSF